MANKIDDYDENMSIDETFGHTTSIHEKTEAMITDSFSPMISKLKLEHDEPNRSINKNVSLNINNNRNTSYKANEDTFTDHTFNSIFSNETGNFQN
jgi:hypothetical protein